MTPKQARTNALLVIDILAFISSVVLALIGFAHTIFPAIIQVITVITMFISGLAMLAMTPVDHDHEPCRNPHPIFALITLVPFIMLLLLIAAFAFGNENTIGTAAFMLIPQIFFISIILMPINIYFVLANESMPLNWRILWTVSLFAMSPLVMPLYWYVFQWRHASAESVILD